MIAFVTYGGMNSVFESLSRDVPMITVPLFAEQRRNAAMVRRAYVGTTISIDHFVNPEKFAASLLTVPNNTR